MTDAISLPFLLYSKMYKPDFSRPNLALKKTKRYEHFKTQLNELIASNNDIDINHVYEAKDSHYHHYQFNGESMLSYCIKKQETDLIFALLKRDDVDINIPNGKPLLYALQKENIELIKALLKKGANIPESLNASEQATLFRALADEDITEFFSQVQHYYYQSFINDIHEMIFISTDKIFVSKSESENKPATVVYNNNGYFEETDLHEDAAAQGVKLYQGQPLALNNIPIGYNITLPDGEIKSIIMYVYGGSQINSVTFNALSGLGLGSTLNLFDNNIALIEINTPDLLELHGYQLLMPHDLFLKIQQCIHHMHHIITQNPESLHPRLASCKAKSVFLFGASFGGMMTLRHAELFPHTFSGYITHDGCGTSGPNEITRNDVYPGYLNPANPQEITKISEPILMMHNMDDNNVSVKETLGFYKAMHKSNKHHLVQLGLTNNGNLMPADAPRNKGHFFPENAADLKRYNEILVNFVQNGPSKIPALAELQAYLGNKKAMQHINTAHADERFIAEALEFARQYKHTFRDINKTWETQYKPLFYAIYYSKQIVADNTSLQKELTRLQVLITDEHLIKFLESQTDLFFQYMFENYRKSELANHPQLKSEFTKNSRMIAMVRQTLSNITNPRSNTSQPRIINRYHARSKNTYFLIALYKANPELLASLYPTFESDTEMMKVAKEAQHKLISVISKKHALTFGLWRDTAKEAVKHEKADKLYSGKKL